MTLLVASWAGPARAAAVQPSTIERLVAVVDQRALTATDLQLAIRLGSIEGEAADEAASIDRLVTRELIRLEVERFAVAEPTPEAVEARIATLSAGTDRPAWLAGLEVLGASSDRVRRLVADDLRIAAYVEQRFSTAAQPTEAEVLARAASQPDALRPTTPPAAAALTAARDALLVERRQALLDDWVAGLRRRTSVRVVGRR